MYDDKILEIFMEKQLKLYPETVANSLEEAREFLEDSCAVVAQGSKEVISYLEDVGVDTEGLGKEEILSMPEVFNVGDGRFLILEI